MNGRTIQARTRAFSLIEVLVSASILAIVVGPLMYTFTTGSQVTTTRHSAALMNYNIASERLRHDMSQMVYPDGPDGAGGKRKAFFRIENPGPYEGGKITFWVPRIRKGGASSVPREVRVVPVSYSLEPIPDTDTFRLVRELGGKKGYLPGVVLRYLWFKHLRSFPDPSGPSPPTGGGDAGSFNAQAIRVYLTAVEKAATDAQMDDLPEARRVKTFGMGFLRSVKEPTLVWRMRDPAAGKNFQFIDPEGDF